MIVLTADNYSCMNYSHAIVLRHNFMVLTPQACLDEELCSCVPCLPYPPFRKHCAQDSVWGIILRGIMWNCCNRMCKIISGEFLGGRLHNFVVDLFFLTTSVACLPGIDSSNNGHSVIVLKFVWTRNMSGGLRENRIIILNIACLKVLFWIIFRSGWINQLRRNTSLESGTISSK